MEEIIESLRPVSEIVERIQSILALEFLSSLVVNTETVKSATIATVLSIQWGIHFTFGWFLLWLSLWDHHQEKHRIHQAWTWCFYITAMCSFHLLEFFVTAFFNPTAVSSDSFLVNHSKAYTVAAILATAEFWFRFLCASGSKNKVEPESIINYLITALGVFMVVISQIIRTFAMMTCGESFNHYIQTLRKDNHILVTNGIYSFLRHPSYVGFYYWAIGSQVLLHNYFSLLIFAGAGWKFFGQRIPYEERSLIRLFGDKYYNYTKRTYMGIPFIPSIPEEKTNETQQEEKEEQQQQQIVNCKKGN